MRPSPYEIEFLIVLVLGIVVIPVVAYLTFTRTRQRKRISERGIKALAGKCPLCGGKLKVVDLFAGRANLTRYRIGAARCTRCNHLEIFSEEP